MIYGSVCSGIEAATVAWAPLGWRPVFVSEIHPFASAVLRHHYPDVPNYGDLNCYQDWPHAAFDVLIGGTPCQSFSVAGFRAGLADPRGNLALVYLGVVERYRPGWVVWENVPGVLSSGNGRDLGAFLGALAELGYGWAYRVLDAQFVRVDGFGRAVPQRRRRVFVVGCARGWPRAAAVLFDTESLQGNTPPRRQAGEEVAGTVTARAANGSRQAGQHGSLIPEVAGTLGSLSATGGYRTTDLDGIGAYIPEVANVLTARMHKGINTTNNEGQTMVAHALRAGGHDAMEDGSGRGTPLVVVNARQDPDVLQDLAHTLGTSRGGDNILASEWAVRKLTPRECERLMGFPDDYTLIPYGPRGRLAKDSPRYHAIGNSMAVNVIRWLGRRIAMVDQVED